MVTTIFNSSTKAKSLFVRLQKNHFELFTLILTKNEKKNKAYDIFINDSQFTTNTLILNDTATHKIQTTHLKDGQNQIKIIMNDSSGVEEIYEESFYYSSSLKLRKIAKGVTFDVFQWKRPQNSNNSYKIVFNGKEFEKVSKSRSILETICVSNFINGRNTIEVIAYTLNSDKRITERLDFDYMLE